MIATRVSYRSLAQRAALLVTLGALASACSSDDSGLGIGRVEIENDAQLLVDAGQGAGVYVEYYSGGDWYVYTTCDTARSGFGCQFDIDLYVPEGNKLRDVVGDDLEFTEDYLDWGGNLIQLSTWTYDDFDGVAFSTRAGAPLRIDFTLDDFAQPEVLFWNERGEVRDTAPSIPLDFEPEAP
jgi:hypothetical protein